MITIEELISIAEEVYGNENKANERNAPLWLIKEHVKALNNLISSNKINTLDDHLSKSEVLSIVMLEGFAFDLIQNTAFNPEKSNNFTKNLVDLLDSALLKIPKCIEPVLYRYDKYDNGDHVLDKKICIKGFFTTSKEDYDKDNLLLWIITPLSPEKTKAHEIYRVYNHGDYGKCDDDPEYQIEFERGTVFVVKKTKVINGRKTIYINELETK